MSGLAWDLEYALRAIRRQPGLSVVVALTLAFGLAVNATVLGMMDALLFRPFPFRDYERLVVLWETRRGATERQTVAPASFLDWRRRARSLELLAAWEWWDATLGGREEPERVQAYRVSFGFFELLGITPAIGRTFTPGEERPGEHRRVVIGDGLWKRRFGADPAVVGRELLLDAEPYTIVGVAPPRFAFPVGSELWVPLAFSAERSVDREGRTLTVAGKLARGRTLAEAQAEMDVIRDRLELQYPAANRERGLLLQNVSVAFREDVTLPVVATLQAAAGLVLLGGGANIASLLLARAIDRQRELALRKALGASRARIARQLVVETAVLALGSSVLALVLAGVGLDVLRCSIPADVARFVEGWDNLRLDGRLALAVPALAIAIGCLVGLAPAILAARTEPAPALKEGALGRLPRQAVRQVLVGVEIAFAVALLSAAGLALVGAARLVGQPGGFDPDGLLVVEIPVPERPYPGPSSKRQLASALLARMEALPGVERAALANILPAAGWSPMAPLSIDGEEVRDPGRRPDVGNRVVSDGFFQAMRVPILKGRAFSGVDIEEGEPVAIISASVAKRFWPGRDPLGSRLRLDGPESGWLTIVGVAGDVMMYNWWDHEDLLAVYRPLRQAPPRGMLHAVVRGRGGPAAMTPALRHAVRAADPWLPVQRIRTMRQAIADSSVGLTYLALLMGICGGIALVLSVVGVYAVMAYTMRQRSQEFAVRMALGGTRGDVLRSALRQAAMLSASGVAAGLLLAVLLGRAMATALFGVVPLEPSMFAAAGVALAAVSLTAAFLASRRIWQLDPAVILRG
jgi:putative ABC transport system permease protein